MNFRKTYIKYSYFQGKKKRKKITIHGIQCSRHYCYLIFKKCLWEKLLTDDEIEVTAGTCWSSKSWSWNLFPRRNLREAEIEEWVNLSNLLSQLPLHRMLKFKSGLISSKSLSQTLASSSCTGGDNIFFFI